jgi:hypothetical protein
LIFATPDSRIVNRELERWQPVYRNSSPFGRHIERSRIVSQWRALEHGYGRGNNVGFDSGTDRSSCDAARGGTKMAATPAAQPLLQAKFLSFAKEGWNNGRKTAS